MYNHAVRTNRPPEGSARERILQATLEIVGEGGIDAVTHRAVAARAGVSPGSTTHHFAGRAELLREAFRHHLRRADALIAELDHHTRRSADDTTERLLGLAEALVRSEFQHPEMVRAEYHLYLFAATDPILAADVRVWESHLVATLAAPLEAAGARRPLEAARTLVNLVRGFELERLVDDRLDANDLRRRLEPVIGAVCELAP
jgi:DNA-binding transcriptional regulator YbjK